MRKKGQGDGKVIGPVIDLSKNAEQKKEEKKDIKTRKEGK